MKVVQNGHFPPSEIEIYLNRYFINLGSKTENNQFPNL